MRFCGSFLPLFCAKRRRSGYPVMKIRSQVSSAGVSYSRLFATLNPAPQTARRASTRDYLLSAKFPAERFGHTVGTFTVAQPGRPREAWQRAGRSKSRSHPKTTWEKRTDDVLENWTNLHTINNVSVASVASASTMMLQSKSTARTPRSGSVVT